MFSLAAFAALIQIRSSGRFGDNNFFSQVILLSERATGSPKVKEEVISKRK